MLRSICQQVDSICADIKDKYVETSWIEFASLAVGDERPRLSKAHPHRQVNVVGVEDEAKKLIGYLTRDAEHLDILAVIGVAGLGMTTLAWKVFSDPAIKYEFPTRIWIYVSGHFTKDIFLAILREFMKLPEVVYGKSDVELATLVAGHLERRKFLIVMDDVWKPEDWEELRIAFPTSNKMGKVLITSRFQEVADFANPNTPPLKLRFLEKNESWSLFQQEVFGKCRCPLELKDVGELISGKCHGLPLTIMVIAGMLVENYSSSDDLSARSEAWLEVSSEILAAYIEEPLELLKKAISLSYKKLPYYLKECFLYLAIFPEDYEIPVVKLIHMWIAEGFIRHDGNTSLEEIAEGYLEELITRNLVKTDKINSRGKVKTCRIHDMIRDLCRDEASKNENLPQEMTKCGDGVFEPPLVSDARNCHRLCVHSDADTLDFLSSKPYGPRIRSFICFSKDEINLPLQKISAIPAAFKLLRVLEATPIKFTKVPRNLYHLIHLKYIAISFSLSILPAAFSKFWNIQTLVVNTTSYTLEVKADIWNMIQLRHFKTNASATLPSSTEGGKSEKLQTLGTISPQSCSEEVFNKASNLKKLSIRGQLSSLLDGNNGSFGSLKKLVNLEKLKLLNGVFYSIEEGRLPPASEFPPKLRSLTLSNIFLEWSHMSILGSLEKLEVLKLKDYAFVGEKWEVTDRGFRSLEVLHIGCTNLVNWKASSHHFPKLRWLELRNCEELCEVPIELADIPSLQILGLYRTTTAAASAVKVEEVKRNLAQQSSGANAFELSISPPHDS
ncbi:hypothetical protein C2S52_005220 [Perilla frutescens var. hirtella]|nr:hypothetical protein C2S52_005220 [Perilla frutescens var. hirtella]